MARILFVIAKKDFKDEEYFIPWQILETAGHSIKAASNTKAGELAFGASGGEVKIDFNLNEIKSDNFDAIIFVGGPGALKNLDNAQSYRLAQDAFSKNKLIAAICVAPVILARAGVLNGKKVTVWSSPLDRSPIKILKENEAIYEDKPVVVDGKILTANGPSAATEFGEKLVELLNEIEG